jgi:drug/metabolite transporter (DMT)-like permease
VTKVTASGRAAHLVRGVVTRRACSDDWVSGTALGLVVLAGFVHAVWNLIAKRASAGVPFSALATLVGVIAWAPVGMWVLWGEAPAYQAKEWLLLALSGTLHVLYYTVLLRGYEIGDLSVVYPLARGTGPLITFGLAIVLLDERPGLLGLIGVLMIAAGMVIITTGGSLARFRNASNTAAGIRYGLATGVFIAAYSLLDGYSVKTVGISPIALDYGSNLFRLIGTFAIAAVVMQRSPFDLRVYAKTNFTAAALVGILSPIPYVLVLQAATLEDISKVAPAREVSMLFAALFAGSLLHEENARVRLVGAISIALGVAAIALA